MHHLEETYTAEWFAQDFTGLQPEFDIVADAIYRQFRPELVTDVGCGPGMILRRLLDHHVEVSGIEGSRHGVDFADAKVQGWITVADLTTIQSLPHYRTRRHVVVCSEVAEHLDAEHAAHLVALLCSAMCPIVFTAAPPGQDGHHHVNCQPQEYWEALFRSHGVVISYEDTQVLTARWGGLKRLSHMAKNVMVFR